MQKFITLTVVSVLLLSCAGSANNAPTETNNNLAMNESEQMDTVRRPATQKPVNIDNIRFTTVVDPKERSFSISMPVGWKNEAYLSRTYNLYRAIATTTSPDSRISFFMGDARMASYMVPNSLIDQNSEMATWNPLMKVAYYVDADSYFSQYIQEKFGSLPGFKIISKEEAPEFAQVYYDANLKNGRQVGTTSTRIKFQYTGDNKIYYGLINGVTIDLSVVWVCEMNGIISLDKPERFNKVLLSMLKSSKTDPEWKNQQQAIHEQKMAQLRRDYQNQQIAFSAMNQQHEIRMQNMQASHNAHNQNWANQQASIDRNHERFINVIRGEHTVADASGNTFQVDNSHQKYFVNKHNNTYIGSHSTTSIDDLRRINGVNPDDYQEVKIIR